MVVGETKMDFSEMRKYIGHLDQLFNIKRFAIAEEKQRECWQRKFITERSWM